MKLYLLLGAVIIFANSSYALRVTKISQIEGNEKEITEIDFSNQGLMEFPKEILTCDNLISLNLSDNGLINIPIELGNLKKLKEINFSGNQGISYVDLGVIFKVAHFRLEELHLRNCEMGYLPNEIGSQKGLLNLDVSGNKLNDLPYPVIQLTKLEYVDASNNDIEDVSWQVNQWWNLKSLNLADNKRLKTDELIYSLSVKSKLDKLVLSHLESLPKVFEKLKVSELEIHNSQIVNFPRLETSTPIERIKFIGCKFKRPAEIVKIINEYCQPEFLGLNRLNVNDLNHFLKIEVDSVDIQNNGLTDISVLANVKELGWVDARGNNISESSIEKVKLVHPEIKLLLSEPVESNKGIKPPFENMDKPATINVIVANKDNQVSMGSSTFNFNKKSFLDENGNIYNGEVKIEYTEYFEPADVFLSGITMTSDSANESLIFESAGMFNLTATDDKGGQLLMNPEAEVEVDMMSTNPDQDMNVYFLNEQGRWEFKGKDRLKEPFKLDMAKVNAVADSAFLNFKRSGLAITRDEYFPSIGGAKEAKSFTIRFVRGATDKGRRDVEVVGNRFFVKKPQNAEEYLAKQSFVYDGDIDSVQFYKKWFKVARKEWIKSKDKRNGFAWEGGMSYYSSANYFSNIDVKRDKKKDQLKLNFRYKDSLISLPVVLIKGLNQPKNSVKLFEKFYKGLYRSKRKDELLRRKRSRMAQIKINKEEMELKNMARSREASRQRLVYNSWEEMHTGQVSATSVVRSFSLSNFGIWNCDRRARMNRVESVPRAFVSSENGEPISGKVDAVTVIDLDNNGVGRYGNIKSAFYDKSTKNLAIVVFFSATIVGVYRSWKEKINGRNNELPLKMLDVSTMNPNSFQRILMK